MGADTALCSRYQHTIKGQFFGHIHIDQWTLTRSCQNHTGNQPYIETTGAQTPDFAFPGLYLPLEMISCSAAYCPLLSGFYAPAEPTVLWILWRVFR